MSYTININVYGSAHAYHYDMNFKEPNGKEHRMQGEEPREATANGNALFALTEALKHISGHQMLNIITDNQQIYMAFHEGWLVSWKKNGWKTARGKDVRNAGEWKNVDMLISRHSYRINYPAGNS